MVAAHEGGTCFARMASTPLDHLVGASRDARKVFSIEH